MVEWIRPQTLVQEVHGSNLRVAVVVPFGNFFVSMPSVSEKLMVVLGCSLVSRVFLSTRSNKVPNPRWNNHRLYHGPGAVDLEKI